MLKARSGVSMIYLGFSIIIFAITFGITFYLIPMILGAVISAMPAVANPVWAAQFARFDNVLHWLIPAMAAIILTFFAIKVFLNATNLGRD